MTSSSAIVQPVLYNDDFSSTINDEEDGNESILFHDSAKTLKLDPYYALLSETAEAAMHGLKDSTDFILEFIAPIIWCVIFVAIMDRESFVAMMLVTTFVKFMLDSWKYYRVEVLYMPFLGIFAALLANSVPIGGGIVYIPVLHLLGVNIKLGVAFTVAVMTFGNGGMGFLRWLKKDHTLIIWESFPFTVLPSSIATLLAIYLVPSPNIVAIKRLFGGFCIALGIIVGVASRNGGISRTISPLFSRAKSISSSEISAIKLTHSLAYSTEIYLNLSKWIVIGIISFLAGFILVPNIGIGPALTTYILLELYGYEAERAIVTGIITGGWVCILPFLIHWIEFGDIPWRMWIMVLPGVYIGAKYAPLAHTYIGINNILMAFAVFLFCTSYIFLIDV